MPDLPEVRERFVADTTGYSRPLREAANEADRFGDKNDKAALAARRMGLAAKEAADKAARAQRDAADAADRLAKGEIGVDEAAQAAAKAERELERASLKAAEAQRATANAADKAADNYRQMARDAELAAAAQRLGALKAAGASVQYNAMLRKLKEEHGNLKNTAVSGFKEMEVSGNAAYRALTAGGEKLGELGPVWTVGISNALINLPAIASVAAGGITLALGGALSAVGLMAAAKNKDVQRTFHQMTTSVGADLKTLATPFESTLIQMSNDAEHAFKALEPSLEDAFGAMAPAVSRFSAQLAYGLSGPRVQKAITAIGHDFSVVLDALGPATASAIGDVATAMRTISDAAAKNPQALAGMVSGIGQLIRYTGDGIGALIRFKDQISTIIDLTLGPGPGAVLGWARDIGDLKDSILGVNHGLQIGGGSFPTFAEQAAAARIETQHFATTMDIASVAADKMGAQFDALAGKTIADREGLVGYRQAVTALTQSLKENGHAHGFATEKGARNEQALDTLAAAAQKAATAMKSDGRSAKDVAQFLDGARQRIIAAAEKMHYSAGAARELANKLLGVRDAANSVPSGKNTHLSSNAAAAAQAIRDYQRWINSLHGKTVYVHTVYTASGSTTFGAGNRKLGNKDGGYIHRAMGGPVQHFDSGGPSGPVIGPGTGTSDSIPAMLSNGEYVINAKQTEKYRPLLDAINYKLEGFANGGILEGYAKGGKAKPPTKAQKAAAAARISHAKARPEYLAAMAAQQALAALRTNSLMGMAGAGLGAGSGSGAGTVVQHVTNITVQVAGSIRSDRDLVSMIQSKLLSNRIPVSLPAGR